MLNRISVCLLTSALLVSCNDSTNPEVVDKKTESDYIVGQTYSLKMPAFIFSNNRSDPKESAFLAPLGFSGTPTSLDAFEKQASNNRQVAGLLYTGDTLRVVKITKHRLFNVGRFIEAHALITSGPHTGTSVELSMISKGGRPASTVFVDPNYLAPANPSP